MKPAVEAEREQLLALFRRMIQLGQLLPGRGDDIEMTAALEDPATRADASMVLREMSKVEAEVNAMVEEAKQKK